MAPAATAPPDRETLLEIYRRTVVINRTDERFRSLIRSGTLAIAYYSPRGQEVLAAALMTALEPTDYLVTTYRGVHDQLAKGVPVKDLWAEYAGRATGTCKGKGGPMHITHPKTGVMVTTGIVGSGLPIANGLALSSQVRGDGRVTVCCFGDGATNIGAFHEALNMASVWKLPVVFVCQNNEYAESTRYADGTSAETIAQRGVAYSMRAVTVEGNDPTAMYAAAADAVARARAGEGPTLIEAKTFRFMGHYFGDPSAYIPKGEMEAAVARDPVPAFRVRLLDQQVPEAALAAIEAEVEAELEAAVAAALASPFPDAAEIRRDVFKAELAA
jgi:TPP-dependent pyruvate/acetoin dehydrogenase alpha subunit